MLCRAIIVILTAAVFCVSAASAQEKTDDVIRVDTNLVTIPVVVSDRDNRYIAGLKKSDFSIYKDGEKQSIDYFASEEAPISVALLLDTSRSTQQVLGKIKKAAQEFIKHLRPDDRAMIVTFDYRVSVLSELTGDRERLKRAVKDAEIGEMFGTVLNDAVFEALTKGLSGFNGRKAVILLTDGKDAGSVVRRQELLYRVAESDAMIYSVFYETGEMPLMNDRPRIPDGIFGGGMRRGGIGRGRDQMPERRRRRIERNNEEAAIFLGELAERSAGRFYRNDVGDLSKTFESIAGELRNQYLVGFYPDKIESGKLYGLRIQVARDAAVVRSKKLFRAK